MPMLSPLEISSTFFSTITLKKNISGFDSISAAKDLKCCEPGCTGNQVLRWSKMRKTWFYGCSRYPVCYGSLTANDDGSPKGLQEPRKRHPMRSPDSVRDIVSWRKSAGDVFISLKPHFKSLKEECQWLRCATTIPRKLIFHPAQMTIYQCSEVVDAAAWKGPGTEFWSDWQRGFQKTLWDWVLEP